MLQIVVSRHYFIWVFISTLFTLMAVISLTFPNWMLRTESEIRRFNPCRLMDHPTAIGPMINCDSYCTKKNTQVRCLWIWKEVLSASSSQHVLDIILFGLLLSGWSFAILGNVLVFICSCKRDFRDINTFQVTGVLEFLSAISFILILIFWIISWSSTKFRSICGAKSYAFSVPNCKSDWALYTFCCATVGLILAGIYSMLVDKSICNANVTQQLLIGHQINFV